jgi:hypothetical protein
MGGYGSGRPGNKQKIEGCKSLDVNRFHREGILATGRRGSWIWSQDAVEVGRIDYEAQEGRLILKYKVQRYGDEWEHVRQSTPVVYVPCHYGGQRPYFQCPGVVSGRHCGRRVAKLFLGGNYFLCRHCYRLAYSSQSEPRYDRMLRRANKLRHALGGDAGTANLIAPKPKGMSQRTYQRKRFEIEWCEGQANHLFIARFEHLLSGEEREMYFWP